jgi:thiamine biosynthesis lipoprotein
VNAGGDLRVFGESDFPVAIRDPRSPTEIALHVQLRDEALATSGSYFSRKQIDGCEVSALLNGRTGAALTAAVSTSVRAPSCMLADALTKVVLASGDAAHPALRQFGATAFIL